MLLPHHGNSYHIKPPRIKCILYLPVSSSEIPLLHPCIITSHCPRKRYPFCLGHHHETFISPHRVVIVRLDDHLIFCFVFVIVLLARRLSLRLSCSHGPGQRAETHSLGDVSALPTGSCVSQGAIKVQYVRIPLIIAVLGPNSAYR